MKDVIRVKIEFEASTEGFTSMEELLEYYRSSPGSLIEILDCVEYEIEVDGVII